MSDLSLSNNNDIMVSEDKCPTKVQIVGSADLINPNNNKLKLTIERAKEYDAESNKWKSSGTNFPITNTVADAIFDRLVNGGDLNIAGDPKRNIEIVKETQRLVKVGQKAADVIK